MYNNSYYYSYYNNKSDYVPLCQVTITAEPNPNIVKKEKKIFYAIFFNLLKAKLIGEP